MSFLIATQNGTISASPPPGSIMAYLGTSDPNGWVICDGVTRTNNSDYRYNNLNTLGIGSGGSGTTNYTPPNFKGSFLRGIGTATINTAYSGPTSLATNPSAGNGQYQDMGVLPHGHTVTDTGHKHNTITSGTTYYGLPYNANSTPGSLDNTGNEYNMIVSSGLNLNTAFTTTNTTGITVDTGSVNTTASYYVSTESRPYNLGVNWILKL